MGCRENKTDREERGRGSERGEVREGVSERRREREGESVSVMWYASERR